MRRIVVLLSVFLAAVAMQTVSAQAPESPRPSLFLGAGASFFDLSGTGTAPMGVVRADLPLNRFLAVDGGFLAARPEQQFGATTTLLAPELGLELQLPTRVAPYIAADAGRAFDIRGQEFGGTLDNVTYSAALGARAWITQRAGVRGELRLRGIGGAFQGSAAELTLGMTWR